MKKILALLLALALLLGALPALADSLTPDDVIGTWSLYRMAIGKQVQNESGPSRTTPAARTSPS